MPSTVIVGGTTITPLDTRLVGQTIALGGIGGLATLDFLGDAGITALLPTLDAGSEIESLMAGQGAAEASLLQAAGQFVNRGTIAANAAHGGTFTLLAQPGPGTLGVLVNAGEIDAIAGNALTLVAQAGATVLNAGLVQAQGGSILIAPGPGGSLAAGGLVNIANGGTVELAGAAASTVVFQDGKGDLLRLDQPASFTGTVAGFAAGDTVDIGHASVGSISYSITGLLTLSNAGSIVARITLAAGAYPVGTWSVVKGVAGSFLVSTDANGDTRLSTSQVPVTAAGRNGLYSASTTWAGGAAPNAANAVLLGPAARAYTVTTGTVAVQAGALLITGPQATLEIDRSLTVGPQPAMQEAGTLDVAAGAGLLSSGLVQLGGATFTRIDPGGVVVLSGLASGRAVAVEGTLLVNGGKIVAGAGQATPTATGGSIAIGLGDGPQGASATVQAGGQVTDTGAVVGAGPVSAGTLVLTGAGTSWSDLVATTQGSGTTGIMQVGVSSAGAATGLPAIGPATLVVTSGAVLTEASTAVIGAPGSRGAVTVSAGGRWQIGAGAGAGAPALTVGGGGAGSLSVLNGGTVTAGAAGVVVGATGGAGLILVSGAGSTMRSTGAVTIGAGGSGTLSVAGQGASVVTPGPLMLGAGGPGLLSVSGSGLIEAGGVQVQQGSTATVSTAGGIDVGVSGSVVAGAVLIEAGRTLAGDGLVAASIVNNGTLLAVPGSIGGTPGTLEVTGGISGNGTIALQGGAVAQFDGAVGAGQTIAFAPGGGLLNLLAPASTFAAPLIGLDTGDKIASPQWSQIISVQLDGATRRVDPDQDRHRRAVQCELLADREPELYVVQGPRDRRMDRRGCRPGRRLDRSSRQGRPRARRQLAERAVRRAGDHPAERRHLPRVRYRRHVDRNAHGAGRELRRPIALDACRRRADPGGAPEPARPDLGAQHR